MSKIDRIKELIAEFGMDVTAAKLFQAATKKVPYIKYIAGRWKYKAITNFLYRENKTILEEFNSKEGEKAKRIGMDSPVWMLWWQGIGEAPEIVKICINSVKANIGTRRLILLDQNNYQEYVHVPSKYSRLLEKGQITLTQYSDILRLHLLYQWGGVWLDATYLLTDRLMPQISELPFFSIRHGMNREYPMSKGLWSGSALAAGKGNRNIKLFLDIYEQYFEKHKALADYLLIDYIFAVCCDNCPDVKEMFCRVPKNNCGVNELLPILNRPYDEQLLKKALGDTTMCKLSWKYPVFDLCGDKSTVYGHFKKLYLE